MSPSGHDTLVMWLNLCSIPFWALAIFNLYSMHKRLSKDPDDPYLDSIEKALRDLHKR